MWIIFLLLGVAIGIALELAIDAILGLKKAGQYDEMIDGILDEICDLNERVSEIEVSKKKKK